MNESHVFIYVEVHWDVHGDTLSVDGSQVGVFEQGDEVSFSGFLKGHNSRGLEAQVGLQPRVSDRAG